MRLQDTDCNKEVSLRRLLYANLRAIAESTLPLFENAIHDHRLYTVVVLADSQDVIRAYFL